MLKPGTQVSKWFAVSVVVALALFQSSRLGAIEIVETIAGGGSLDGYAPDEANLALGSSQGLAVSALGEICFSDSGHNQVLKLNPSTGRITVVAGNGTASYNGDGLPGPSAGLNAPGALAFDAQSNLLIADRGNFAVRSVNGLSGIITTIAGTGLFTGQVVGANPPAVLGDGGPALSATFGNLGDLTVDSSGAVLVCDSGNACVRKFTVGGTIATIAGTPGTSNFGGDGVLGGALAARFNAPTGIAIDNATGAIYIADSGNRRVRKLTSDATVATVVGSGSGGNTGFTGDGEAAITAQIGSLGGLAFDAAGNLLICCIGSNRIRISNAKDVAAVITTIAGNGGADVLGDLGPATGATLSAPRDIAADSAGNIYIYDSGRRRIRRVDEATGFIDTVVGTGLFGFVGDRGPKQNGILAAPSGATFDSSGNLYVADTGDNAVRRISLDGIITTFAGDGTSTGLGDGGPATLATLSSPQDVLAVGNTLFIADNGNDRIRAVDLTTNLIRTYASISSPRALIANSGGVLFVAHDDQVDTVDLAGTVTPFAGDNPMDTAGNPLGDGLAATNATLDSPNGLALNAAGELFIADTGNDRIRKIGAPPGLLVSTFAGGGTQTFPAIGDGGQAAAAVLNAPIGVAVDASRLLISDTGNHRIRAVDLNSKIINTVSGNGIAGFTGDGDVSSNAQVNLPGRMFFNGTNLVFADVNNNRIRQLVPVIDIDPKLISFALKLNFTPDSKTGEIAPNKDAISLKANLPLPPGINAANLVIKVDIVDLHQQIRLDSAGKQPKAAKPTKSTIEPTEVDFTLPAPPAAPVSKFALGLKGTSALGAKPVAFSFSSVGTFREEFGRAGFMDVNVVKPGLSVPVRINISIGSITFSGVTTALYIATQDKSGAAKSVKVK